MFSLKQQIKNGLICQKRSQHSNTKTSVLINTPAMFPRLMRNILAELILAVNLPGYTYISS